MAEPLFCAFFSGIPRGRTAPNLEKNGKETIFNTRIYAKTDGKCHITGKEPIRMSENLNNDRMKRTVFSLVLALVALAVVLIAVRAFLLPAPPATVQSLMTRLDVPATVSVNGEMREAVQESFQNEFSALYGIDLAPEEAAYFSKLLQDCTAEFDIGPFLLKALRQECYRRRLTEEAMVRQLMGIRDPAEQEKIRAELTAAGQAAMLKSEDFLRAMEPVYRNFYEWWTPRHPEYGGVAAGITLTDDHEALIEQIAVSIRREIIVRTAQQLSTRLETDLRKLGKVISEAKLKQAFALFVRLGKERYTAEAMRSMADAIVKEAELTDEEILHCLLLKDRTLSEDRLSTIQDVQLRCLTARTLDGVPAETVSEIQKELRAITGIEYTQESNDR